MQAEKKQIKSFRDLIVWQKALQLFLDASKDVKKFPSEQSARIIEDQILRSSSSISANIAEGYGRYKGKEFSRFLHISRGSATETQDWYIKISKLGLINDLTFKARMNQCEEIVKIINAIISKLKNK